MTRKIYLISLINVFSIYSYLQNIEDIKSKFQSNVKNLLAIPNYNRDIYISVRINEIKKHFENLDIKLQYKGKKRKIIVKGVPELPNQKQLTKLLKQSISKVWQYLIFPYIFDVLSKNHSIKSATLLKRHEDYHLTIINTSTNYKNVREWTYIFDENYLPKKVYLKYKNGKNKTIKLELENIEADKYVIHKVNEEFKTSSGAIIYTSSAVLSYKAINETMLPKQLSYKIKFHNIPLNFPTTVEFEYISILEKSNDISISDKRNKEKFKTSKENIKETISKFINTGSQETLKDDTFYPNPKAKCVPKKSNK